MARRKARELAFRTLFQAERGGAPLADVWTLVRSELGESDAGSAEDDREAYGDVLDHDAVAFAGELLDLFDRHRGEVDGELERIIEGWTFGQMAQTDLNILRLAVTEMRYVDTPPQVAIEMAVRLAKRFGGDQSGRFVNGVLGRAFERGAAPSGGAGSTVTGG